MAGGLDELAAAVAVARHRSFRAAAVELGMSRSALSHAIAALEARLSLRLFHRTTRSVSPTEAGADFLAAVAPALADIRAATEAAGARRASPSGTLRINSSVDAARQTLPLFLAYLRRYPDMKVDLVTEGRLIDIVGEGFDAGIRIAEIVPQDMTAIVLDAEQQPMVVCAPSYLVDRETPKTPHDLRRHRCVCARMPSGVIWRWEFQRRGEALSIDVDGPLILNDTSLMIEAVQAGYGFAYLNGGDVTRQLASGELVRVLEEWTPAYPGLRLYYPGRRHLPASLRSLVDLIHERRGAA